jgi:CheY-like chemotaxis protein
VFDIFVRGEESGTSAHAGLGIGLALAKRLVEMHNGTIEAKSEGPGQGSSFTVRVPLAQEDGTPRAESITAHPHTGPVQAPKRILVVDDRPAQAQSLAMLLEIMGHQVRIAHNGDTALQIADEFAPEVGLIDIGLPGMSGYDLARRLRAQPRFRNMLLIAQTGWGRDEDRQSSREAGFDHHMAKPIDHQALFRLLAAPRGDH